MLTAAEANAMIEGRLPAYVGIEFDLIEAGHVRSHLVVRPESVAPNGYLHAAAMVALADTACGLGAVASLPDGAVSFTTIELKANFLGTASEGVLLCAAELVHGGRTTQVWDARVTREADGRLVALFRCTQLLLY